MTAKVILCETCKNYFESARPQYKYSKRDNMWLKWSVSETRWCITSKPDNLDEECVDNAFCIYTHNYERATTCTFYNRIPLITELDIKEKPISDSGDSTEYQDINRTFLSGERQLENRRDCRCVA